MYFNEEKICLITGANSGIGRAAAEALARLGVNLIIAARNKFRGEKTLNELVENSGNRNIELLIADLSSQKEIKALADQIKSKYNRIDILINNAGAYFSKRHLTEDGIEASFAVNYLSRFLLTNLLFDLLKKSKHARIINVSGEHHRRGKINFNNLNFDKKYSGYAAAAQAKLADVLLIYELSRKLIGNKITANSLHPGAVSSSLIYNDPDAGYFSKFFYSILSLFMKSPEKGAETILYLAASPEVSNVSGNYFINKKAVLSSPESYNKALAQKLWDVSEQLTEPFILS
jgi:NAD(P)-dependent dehydrogenase (short-subunit alcohol dehydrogenase family)